MRNRFVKIAWYCITIIFSAIIMEHANCYAGTETKLPYKELIFTSGELPSSHAPSLVELPDGELFAVWYAPPSWADKGVIWGSRRPVGSHEWTKPLIIHSAEGYSNKNPVLYLDPDKKLWLFWSAEKRFLKKIVIDTLMVKTSKDYGRTWERSRRIGAPIGFLARTHPIRLQNGWVILPVYTDWNTSSAILISKDGCMTWELPRNIIFLFGIQPTIIERSDLSLFALMRSGMWPRQAWQAVSKNSGLSWIGQLISNVKNPGSSLEMIKLQNGHVVLVFNDSKTNLFNLSIAISCDDGRTWPHIKTIECRQDYRYCYPSIIQDTHGLIHVLYSYHNRQSIAHFVTNEEWITH